MKIVLWKLGDLEHKIIPSSESIEKLKDIVESHDYNKDLHVVWGPDLKVEVFDLDKNNFLNSFNNLQLD